MLIPGSLLVIGFMFAMQTSAMGASYAVSGFNKAKGYATGAGKGVVKWTADNAGVTRAKNALQYYGTRAGESLSLVNRGTAAANWKAKQATRVDEKGRTERMDALTGSERAAFAGGASNYTNTTNGQLDRVASLKAMAKDNQLGLLGSKERENAMKFIQKFDSNDGAIEKALLKADPELAKHAAKSKAELITTGRAKNDTEAENILKKQSYLQYKTDIPLNDKDRVVAIKSALVDPTTGLIDPTKRVGAHESKIMDEMAKDGSIGKLSKALGGLDNLAVQINHTTEDFGSSARKSLIKIAPHKADQFDKESVDELKTQINPATPGINWTDTDARREVRRKANSRVEARGIKELDDSALTGAAGMEFVNDTTIQKLKKADNLSTDQLNKLKELAKKGKIGGVFVGEINKAIAAAEALGTPEGDKKAEELRKKRVVIRAMY